MKRIKHNDLTHYFLRDREELPKAYLKKVDKFMQEIQDRLITKRDAAVLYKIKQNKISFIKDQIQAISEWRDSKAPEWYNNVGVNTPELEKEKWNPILDSTEIINIDIKIKRLRKTRLGVIREDKFFYMVHRVYDMHVPLSNTYSDLVPLLNKLKIIKFINVI